MRARARVDRRISSAGIGFALSKLLATEHGCAVLLGSRDEKKGSDAVAAIKKLGGKSVELVVIDVASDASVAAAAKAVGGRVENLPRSGGQAGAATSSVRSEPGPRP